MKKQLIEEVIEIAAVLTDKHPIIKTAEALQIASTIQTNRILAEAFMLGINKPSALEMIAMELGAANDGNTIKDAIINLLDQ